MSSTVLVLLFLWLSSALGLLVPQHYCDNHFRYASNDGNRTYIGVFTAPETRSRSLNINLNWQVTFEMQGRRNMFVSPLTTYPSSEEAAVNIKNGQPAQVWVHFINITNELPKLTSLNLNGQELCHSAPYRLRKTRVTVKHHMYITKIRTPIVPTTEVYPQLYSIE
ncbi:uncharacterized protein [Drosophila suzukii]|uniref:Serine protease gd N-terminal domain-containing protein n=1 Tax=Drosophila suzukii TaxID=28584 RepID=A0AB39ZLG7_DROSZ